MKLPRLDAHTLRTAFIAASAAAAMVAVAGIYSYREVHDRMLQNADALLRTHAAAAFSIPARPLPWDLLQQQYVAGYAGEDTLPLAIFWGSTEKEQFYRSKSWPLEMDPHTLIPQLQVGNEWKKSRRSQRQQQGEQETNDALPASAQGNYVSDLEQSSFEDALMPTKTVSQELEGHAWRFSSFLYDDDGVIFGRQMDRDFAQLAEFRNVLVVTCPIAFLLVLGLVSWTARPPRTKKSGKTSDIGAFMEKITADTLTRRLLAKDYGPEDKQLVEAFNEMMDRLELRFEDARRFSGLAAHELKTPLAILQGKLDLAIHEQLPGSPWQQFLAELLEDVSRLKAVTDKLLLLSRVDAGQMELNIVEINLTDLLSEHIEDTELMAPEIKVETNLPPDLIVEGDKTLVNLLLQNLFSNSIKHNSGAKDAFIGIDLREIEGGVRLAVSNSARAIPPELHQRIFSRFGRGEAARKNQVEGAGLGLSLAYEIARVHGGRLKLKESTPQRTTFVLKLRKVALPPPNVSTNLRLMKRVEPLSTTPA